MQSRRLPDDSLYPLVRVLSRWPNKLVLQCVLTELELSMDIVLPLLQLGGVLLPSVWNERSGDLRISRITAALVKSTGVPVLLTATAGTTSTTDSSWTVLGCRLSDVGVNEGLA